MKTSAGKRVPNHERRVTSTSSMLSAARDLFVSKGYAQTSIDEIAHSAGLSKGAVYFYFDNKTALLLDLLQQSETQLFDPVFEKIKISKGSATDKLVLFINWIAGYGAEHKELLLLPVLMSLEFYNRDDVVEQRVRKMYTRLEKELAKIMREGQKQKEFDNTLPAKALAEVVVGLVDGLLLQWYRWSDELDGPTLARSARNLILNGVRAR
jgi:AcrR family transcriptional regulator